MKSPIINTKKYILFFLISIVCVVPRLSYGDVIFQENFDSQNDWQLTQPIGSSTAISAYRGESTIPPNFHSYRIQGSAYNNNQRNSIIIDSTNARGRSGKAMTFWNESGDTNCDAGGGWCSDNQIGIYLPDGYNELYISFYIKFQKGWKWSNESSVMQKFYRATHWHGNSPYLFFNDGNQRPLSTGLLTVWNNGTANISHMLNYRYETTYYPDQASPRHSDRSRVAYYSGGGYNGSGPDFSNSGEIGDGNWHRWEFHIKMNSSVGAEDGLVEYFNDGVLVLRVDDLAFSDNGSRVSPRNNWNYVTLGGNSFNHYAPISEAAEQWYAIDDIIISTTPTSPSNKPIITNKEVK